MFVFNYYRESIMMSHNVPTTKVKTEMRCGLPDHTLITCTPSREQCQSVVLYEETGYLKKSSYVTCKLCKQVHGLPTDQPLYTTEACNMHGTA